jgi:hypothetical protein
VNDDSSHNEAPLSEDDALLHRLCQQQEAQQKKLPIGFYVNHCYKTPVQLFAERLFVPDNDVKFEMPPYVQELWTNCPIMKQVMEVHVNTQAKYENLLKQSMHPLQNRVRNGENVPQKEFNLNQACQNLTVNCAANNMFEILNRDAVRFAPPALRSNDENVTEFLNLFNQILLERNNHALMCSQRRNGQATDKFNVIINRARFLKLQLHDQILSSLLTDAPFSLYYIMCLFEQLQTGNAVNSVQMPVELYYEFKSKMYAAYQSFVDCRATLKQCDYTQDGLKILLDAHNVNINIPKSAYLRNMLQTCFLQKLTACRKMRYQVFGEAYTNYAKLLFANTVNSANRSQFSNGIRRLNYTQNYTQNYTDFGTLLQKIIAQMLGKTRLMGYDR